MLRILNTRPSGQNQELSRLLREWGFESIEIPLVEIGPLQEGLEKFQKLNPDHYGGIFLSSPNGFRLMQEYSSPWMKLPFFTVGSKTKNWIEKLGGTVAFCPKGSSLESFLLEFKSEILKNSNHFNFEKPWLHACSSSTRVVEKKFAEMGIRIENIPVYHPALPESAKERLKTLFEINAENKNEKSFGNKNSGQQNYPEGILFCSGSAVDNFFAANPMAKAIAEGKSMGMGMNSPSHAASGSGFELNSASISDTAHALQNLAVISIGPSTTKALNMRGVTKVQEATVADDLGMVQALKIALEIPPRL